MGMMVGMVVFAMSLLTTSFVCFQGASKAKSGISGWFGGGK